METEAATAPFLAWISGFIALLLGYFFVFIFPNKSSKTKRKKVHRPPLANSVGMLETVEKMAGPDNPWFLLQLAQETNSLIFRLNLPINFVVVGDVDAQLEILNEPQTDKLTHLYKLFAKITGDSILTRSTQDSVWKSSRKECTPAFSKVERGRMKDVCANYLDAWIENVLEPLVSTGGTFRPDVEMNKLNFRVIMDAGFEYKVSDEEYDQFIENFDRAAREFTYRQATNPFRAFLGPLLPEVRQAQRCGQFLMDFGRHILETYRRNPKKSDNFTLIRCIESSAHYQNDEDKIGDILSFIIAGHDTTSYTLANTLVLAAQHQKSCEGIDAMHIVRESQRLCPAVAVGGGRRLGRDMVIGGYQFYKSDNIMLAQIVANRDAGRYKQPKSFLPERWQDRSILPVAPPFAAGQRKCMGQILATSELYSFLPRLLDGYKFTVEEEGQSDFFISLRLVNYKLSAIRREQAKASQ